MDQVAVDLFSIAGQDWLVMVDRFSGFPFAARLRNTSTATVFGVLLGWFCEWGLPRVVRSDNGPQFGPRFFQACSQNGIAHETSSPYYPASNGLAEAAVKSVKFLLNKCNQTGEDFRAALLEWRNVPRADGISPAQAFLGRRQRTALPYLHPTELSLDFATPGQAHFDLAQDIRSEARKAQGKNYDMHAKSLPPLSVGQNVIMQNPHSLKWTEFGIIQSVSASNRSYLVLAKGKLFRRNRIHLRIAEFAEFEPAAHPALATEVIPSIPSPESATLPGPTLPRRSPRFLPK